MERIAPTALVTVTYNGADVWDEFYESIVDQDDPSWRLIVVDNASSDTTREKLSAIADPRVEVVLNDENVGVAEANNQGIARAMTESAKRIVLINNDTVFPPALIRRLTATLESEGADAVSPLIAFHDEPQRIWYGGGGWRRFFAVWIIHEKWREPLETAGNVPFATDYAPTCCVMFDRSVFERIGLMDERYFVYWDDADFVWRMKLATMKLIVDPSIVLLHKVSASTGGIQSDFSIRFRFRNQTFFVRKFHSRSMILYTNLVVMADGLARVILRRDGSRHLRLRARAVREGLSMQV